MAQIVKDLRAQYPPGAALPPSANQQLKELDDARQQIVLDHLQQLKSALGAQRFHQLEMYVRATTGRRVQTGFAKTAAAVPVPAQRQGGEVGKMRSAILLVLAFVVFLMIPAAAHAQGGDSTYDYSNIWSDSSSAVWSVSVTQLCWQYPPGTPGVPQYSTASVYASITGAATGSLASGQTVGATSEADLWLSGYASALDTFTVNATHYADSTFMGSSSGSVNCAGSPQIYGTNVRTGSGGSSEAVEIYGKYLSGASASLNCERLRAGADRVGCGWHLRLPIYEPSGQPAHSMGQRLDWHC